MVFQVLDGLHQPFNAVAQAGKRYIAGDAEQSSYRIGVVAVVNADATGGVAYLASTFVSGREALICGLADPVANPKVAPTLALAAVH